MCYALSQAWGVSELVTLAVCSTCHDRADCAAHACHACLPTASVVGALWQGHVDSVCTQHTPYVHPTWALSHIFVGHAPDCTHFCSTCRMLCACTWCFIRWIATDCRSSILAHMQTWKGSLWVLAWSMLLTLNACQLATRTWTQPGATLRAASADESCFAVIWGVQQDIWSALWLLQPHTLNRDPE